MTGPNKRELMKWFLTLTRWYRIREVIAVQKVEAEHFPDPEQARRVLLDTDSAYICLLLASTGKDASIGQIARAIGQRQLFLPPATIKTAALGV